MAVSWGVTWFVVQHKEPKLNGIICISNYPSSCGTYIDGKEKVVAIPPKIEGFEFVAAKTKIDASNAAMFNILRATQETIAVASYMIADYKLELELLSFELKLTTNEDDVSRIKYKQSSNLEGIEQRQSEIKELKAIRRRKPVEFIESELSSNDFHL